MPTQPIALPSQYTTLRPLRALSALLLDWALIGACFALAVRFPHPAVLVAAAILIARTQLALAVLMHESAHRLLLRPGWLNDVVGQVCTAGPLMLSLFAYRHGHLRHHRDPMTETDPVATVFGIADYPVSRRELAWRLFKDVTSIGYFQTVAGFVSGKFRHLAAPGKPAWRTRALVLGSIVVTNGTMAGALWAAGAPWLYLPLWILPSITLLQLFARIRAITEHAGYGPASDQMTNARTVVRPGWQTFFCGPHAIHYHIEHHVYVRTPFYHLRDVHRLLHAQGVLPEANLYRGYGQVLRDVTSPRLSVK